MKKTLKIKMLLFLLFILAGVHFSAAQNKQDRWEKIKALKVAFITEKIALSPEEAAKFWPVYNKYEAAIYQTKKEKKAIFREQLQEDKISAITETEAVSLLDEIESIDRKKYDLYLEFRDELAKILSQKRILLLKAAEVEFEHKLFDRLKGGDQKAKG